MKKVFTNTCYCIAVIIVVFGTAFSARAQFTLTTVGPPATQASGISISFTGVSSTFIRWTGGSGNGETVFVEAGTTGTPTITNGTTYNAGAQFGAGSTAGSGWYCVYNGTGTSVTVSGLQPETAYTVMIVEHNGQNYLTTAVPGSNTNSFTTESYTIVTTSDPSALTSIAGNAVPVTSFNFTCTNINTLIADAPAGFDISFDNSNWSGQGGQIALNLGINLPGYPLITNRTIYVRLDAADIAGNYSGNIILKDGSGILTVNEAMPSSTVLPNTPTTVNSITAANTYSNSDAIQYAVNFGSTVIGLTPSNFTLTTIGMVSGASVSSVSGSGSSYTVTVNTGAGDGAIGLNLDNNTGFGPTISTSLPFDGETTTIDKTPPTISISSPSVNSIIPGSGSVTYTVTYADANFNTSTLSVPDVTLNATGMVTGTVTLTGSGTRYTVTISNIDGNGTLGISIDAGTATDLAGNLAPASDRSATFMVSEPVIFAMGKLSPLSAIVGSASSSESFDVSGLNLTGDITVTAPAGFDVSPDNSTWSGSGGSFILTPVSGAISATVYTQLDAGDATGDYSGNIALTGGGASEADMLVPPSTISPPNTTVSSITYNGANPTGASDLYYTLTFAAPVAGLTTNNFTIFTTGTAGGNISNITGSGTTFTIDVGSIYGIGTLTLNFDNTAGLTPGLDTMLPYSASTVTINSAVPPPPAISLTGMPMPLSTPSGTPSVSTSFDITGSNLTGNITVTAPSGFDVSADNSTWTGPGGSYIITPTSGDITATPVYVRLDAADAPNPYPGAVTITGGGASVAIMPLPTGMVFPGLPSNTVTSIMPAITYTNAGSVQFAVNFGTQVMGLSPMNFMVPTTGMIGGAFVTSVNGMGSSYTVTVNTGMGDGTIGLNLFNYVGMMPFIANTPFAGGIVTIDRTPPTVSISAPSVSSIGAGSGSVSYLVTYADANFSTSNLTNSGIILNASGTASGTVSVSGSGSSYTVTVTGITGLGTLGISVGAGYASDLAGNIDTGAGPSSTFNVVPSSDATLSNLKLSSGTLSPVFSPGLTSYTAGAPNSASTITVTATPNNAGATWITTVNGTPASGPAPLNPGMNTISVTVTAADGTTTNAYSVTVTRVPSENAFLAGVNPSVGHLSPAFTQANTSYTLSVSNSTASITVKPVSTDPNATIKVNGSTTASGTISIPVTLAEGTQTPVSIVVTAPNGNTKKTYTITVTRAPSANAALSSIKLSAGTLKPAYNPANITYSTSINNVTSTIAVTPTAIDPNATITVNGSPVASGSTFTFNNLGAGDNTLSIAVTAQDGSTKKTYTLMVTRALSENAFLASVSPSIRPLTPVFKPGVYTYALDAPFATSSMTLTPVTAEPNATLMINERPVASGTAFGLFLNVGPNTINIKVTAQDGVTIKTYIMTVTRALPAEFNTVYQPVSVEKPIITPALAEDGIVIHQGISPNGDGINDYLQIDNISQYPENKLSIMNRNGQLVYEAKGYDNSSKTFDGHSNKNGQMQLPGTYFYQLEYTINGITKHKTGFVVLKY